MKVELWLQTRNSTCRVTRMIEVDDEALDGIEREPERDAVIQEYALYEWADMYEKGYNIVEEAVTHD